MKVVTGHNRSAARWRFIAAVSFGLLLAVGGAAAAGNSENGQRGWQFRVLLDGNQIGYHNFELTQEEGLVRLHSKASFKVKFLFFDAYSYDHSNEELWDGQCLRQIDAQTRVNGKILTVYGEQDAGGFVLAKDGAEDVLAGCVMSFAYWKPEFLDQKRLLNSQTGEYVPVAIEPVSEEKLTVRGQSVEAIRYTLDAEKLDMQLWYSPDREWLALESRTKGGRLLRYELL
ncbi:MAG: DUF6134 family protein [Gammaproteobacteria bacterium]